MSSPRHAVRSALLLAALLPAAAQAETPWEFRVTPYAWFAGLKGDVSTIPGAPRVPMEVSPSDALNSTEAAFMGLFEARRGLHGGFVDFLYVNVSADKALLGPPVNLGLDATSKSWVTSAGYSYRFYDTGQANAELLAGVRYWKVDTTLDFDGGRGVLAGRNIHHRESWLDPLLGVRGTTQFGTSNFFVSGTLAAGGLAGGGSDHFYDTSALLGYQWNRQFSTGLGYRLFDVKYDKDGFYYDVRQQGWLLGAAFSF
ncbi:hypothetical protein [Crenobacter intestini]|uniref:Outer membrane protein beta-barrel domain-containing protein n=1 Tax=Crenobacter intestini TaxID=2563443 RepID=A0A4T0UW92_9NEIS|nr:hypothetical protein [Crenobacter intestini]TIC83354.1 hypothetical protein E5K04_07280 [Crenobacter intestini]